MKNFMLELLEVIEVLFDTAWALVQAVLALILVMICASIVVGCVWLVFFWTGP